MLCSDLEVLRLAVEVSCSVYQYVLHGNKGIYAGHLLEIYP